MSDLQSRISELANTSRGDALVAGMVWMIVLTGMSFGSFPDDREIDAIAVLLVSVASAAVYFRRSRPIPALGIATAFGFLYWILDYPNAGAGAAILVLLYSAALHTADRRRATRVLIGFTIALLLVLVAGYLSAGEDEVTVGLIVVNMIMFQFAWLAGDGVRHRRKRIVDLEERTRIAETDQTEQMARAVNEERNRIARELHDVVAHSMSVIVVQAEAAKRFIGRDDDAVRDAVQTIETTGRTNLNDIRGIVGLLRAEGDRSPTPELSMLSTLVDHCSEAGLNVSLEVRGERRALPAMIELSGYRIVQESLTNAIKHAGPDASAAITLEYGTDALNIAVVDNGRGAAADSNPTPGHGLLGMRERVEAFGGDLRTGPRVGGGFSVLATLPVVTA